MKPNYLGISLITVLILNFSISCISNSHPQSVKIINTRAYSTKQEFDKFVINEPVYDLGYDKTMGMDFSWRTRHFDKYNNLIYIETFNQDKNGEEEITTRTTQEYYSPSERKLSLIEEKWNDEGLFTKEYIRNNKGQLLELKELTNNKLTNKTIFTYNLYGQCIKEEIFTENGLFESTTYDYQSTSPTADNIIKSVRERFGKEKTRRETTYERNNNNLVTKEIFKYYNNFRLATDVTTYYSDYEKKVATKITTEGFDGFLVPADQRVDNQKSTTEIVLNKFGDIIHYKYKSFRINDISNVTLLDQVGVTKDYQYEYTYNERNDWTKIILKVNLFPGKFDQFIIVREIKYLD